MAYRYIILDSRNSPLARGYLENSPEASVWTLRVLDAGIENVLEHEIFKLVSMDDSAPDKVGRMLRSKKDRIVLEIIDSLSEDIRNNLRVLARFDTFVYPLSGNWSGRIRVVSHDLSCGGIAFFCEYPLEKGEKFEIVIPITAHPVILRAELIRQRISNSQTPLYAAKFIDMVEGEEAYVREAVFGQQIRNQKMSNNAANTLIQ